MRILTVSNLRLTKGSVGRSGLGFLLGLAALLAPLPLLAANVLQDVTYSALPGNKVQVVLTTAEPTAEPLVFETENPSRIGLDFASTQSGLDRKTVPVGIGAVRSVNVVESGERTRVVVNLVESVPQEMRVAGNQVFLTIGAGTAKPAATPARTAPDEPVARVAAGGSMPVTVIQAEAPAPAPEVRAQAAPMRTAATAPSAGARALRGVDFRRGDLKGTGRVVLTLPSASTVVDTQKESGGVLVEVRNTGLPENLAKTFDVSDYTTPVKNFSVKRSGSDVQVRIAARGDYEQRTYQADNTFTIEFRPASKKETEREKALKPKIYGGERLSLNFQDIEVRSVLQLLADFTGKNMVVSDTVTGRITLRLKNVPWDQALDIILKTKGLAMRESGNVILVAPTEEIAAREKLELESSKQIQELAPLRSDLIRLNFAKAADMATMLKADENKLLSERGNVTTDERTNTLLIQDTADKIEELRDLIAKLDVATRQVLIESRVVIANNDFIRDIGIRWGYSRNDTWGPRDVFVGGSRPGGTIPPAGYPNYFDQGGAQGLMVNLPSLLAETTGRGGAFNLLVGKVGSYLLSLELSAMQQEGRGEIISTPKVITADQTKAYIKQGKEIPYQQATSSGATSVSFKEAVLELEVTPRITPDDRIVMDLLVKKDEADFTRSVLGTPPLDKREVKTSVLVDNGETVVLGGIFEQNKSQKQDKLPFLGDLPYIGAAFRQEERKDNNQELLIFVTPRILKESLRAR
jgi:type IV pilus assembly protein PilQ